MLKYLLKRLLIFIPTLFVISLFTFIISTNAPGDPVELMLNSNSGNESQSSEKLATEKAYNNLRHQLGFDLPVFYFSITDATVSDTLYKVSQKNQRELMKRLAFEYGNWEKVSAYFKQLRKFEYAVYAIEKTEANASAIASLKDNVGYLYINYDEKKIMNILSAMEHSYSSVEGLAGYKKDYNSLKIVYDDMINHASTYKRYIPVIHFYGFENQYHRWISHFLVGDFGISYQDKRPVSSVVWDAIRWTVLISILSMIFAYLIAIPLGVTSAVRKGKKSERIITTVLFMLYSLPSFWIATVLIIFFCGGDYWDIFPAFGLGNLSQEASFWERFGETAYHLILPLFCWTYGSLAFISRQMRGGMLNVLGQDYIRTARAKGLEERSVIWRHALSNSLLPIITLFASIFPLAISGSFVIEYIFSIPGMGKLSLEALIARNYPVVFTIMFFTAILTLLGNLISDILYAMADPRISFSNKK